MADQAPGDTSSTPTAAPAAAAPVTTTTQPAPAASAATATTPASAQPTPAATDSPAATAAPTADTTPTTAATQAPAPAAPAFAFPEDLKLAPAAVEKFTGFLSSKALDAQGKISLTAQELVDAYADQARSAQERWHQQLTEQDKTWAAESKARFTPAQLSAAETGVGFLTSYEPAFRELAQSFRNHPAFTNAMRVIGERLSEDTFEIAGAPAPQPNQKSRAERMGYVKSKTN